MRFLDRVGSAFLYLLYEAAHIGVAIILMASVASVSILITALLLKAFYWVF